ncbi:MAG: succinate dehydrogenase/fumarate reductase iron-sulfur subunit [Chloroflexota bacterium]
MSTQNITVRIRRFNPDVDKKPYWQDFEVELTPEKTVLSVLEEIKAYHDGSLTFRRSCRHAICGSCAMMVNRQNALICTTPLQKVLNRKNVVTIEPLPYLPVIKDLVVDRSAFWEQYERVKPWLVPPDTVPEKEFRMSPDEVAAMEFAETCIMCGACYSSCPIIAGNKSYIGPHALLKAFLRIIDPRDTIPEERIDIVNNWQGSFRCHKVLNCTNACPKGLDPAKAIAMLANMAFKSDRISADRKERLKTLIAPEDIPTVGAAD